MKARPDGTSLRTGSSRPARKTTPKVRSPRPSAAARWLEASIRVPVDAADRIGALLVAAGSQGVVTGVRELAHGARRHTHETVRAFFPSREPVRARLAVRAALNRAGDTAVGRARVHWRELDAGLWDMDWREHFQPVLAGRSLVVVPPWNRDPYPGRHRIVIHPGMAFGTGQHATTRSCLEAMQRLAAPPPARALDVGTGTGVLAIALAKLGVRRVLALDTDPQAIAAARANVRRNRLGKRIRVSGRSLEQHATAVSARPRARSPLVVANLYVDALATLAPTLARVVAPNGLLVTSGVLRRQQSRLRSAFAPPAWRTLSATRHGTWVTTVFARCPSPPKGR